MSTIHFILLILAIVALVELVIIIYMKKENEQIWKTHSRSMQQLIESQHYMERQHGKV